MRIICALAIVLIFTSCQRELSEELPPNPPQQPLNDTTEMFRIVEHIDIDFSGVPRDSTLTIVESIFQNGNKKVKISQLYYEFPDDTTYCLISYNAQGKISKIERTATYFGFINNIQHFTWNGNNLEKIITEEMGVPIETLNLIYTTSGPNTTITTKYTPTQDIVEQNYEFSLREFLTVNTQFQPVQQSYISKAIVNPGSSNPEKRHDTAIITFTYSGESISSDLVIQSRVDSIDQGSIINRNVDTIISTHQRFSNGKNFTDSLRKIYGNEVYALMQAGIINLDMDIMDVYFAEKYFSLNPLKEVRYSARHWVNGQLDQQWQNELSLKADCEFDAQGKLIKMIRHHSGGSDPRVITKIVYP